MADHAQFVQGADAAAAEGQDEQDHKHRDPNILIDELSADESRDPGDKHQTASTGKQDQSDCPEYYEGNQEDASNERTPTLSARLESLRCCKGGENQPRPAENDEASDKLAKALIRQAMQPVAHDNLPLNP